MPSSKSYYKASRTQRPAWNPALLRKLSMLDIKIKPSLLRLYKKLFVLAVLCIAFASTFAQCDVKDFQVDFNGKKSRLAWTSTLENNVNCYVVERSANGTDFTAIGFVKAEGRPSGYFYYDKDYFSGTIYYRVKSIEHSGKEMPSAMVAAIQISEEQKNYTLSPALNLPGAFYLELGKLNGGGCKITVKDSEGQTVFSDQAEPENPLTGIRIVPFEKLQPGLYIINTLSGDKAFTTRLMVDSLPSDRKEEKSKAVSPFYSLR